MILPPELNACFQDKTCSSLTLSHDRTTKLQGGDESREYGMPGTRVAHSCSEDLDSDVDLDNHVPPPVKEPDPILATCATDWTFEELGLSASSTESGNVSDTLDHQSGGLMSPSPYLHYESPDDLRAELLLGTPLHSPQHKSNILQAKSPFMINNNKLNENLNEKVNEKEVFSPIVSWTPNWDEYRSYILSPQNVTPQMLFLGKPVIMPNSLPSGLEKTGTYVMPCTPEKEQISKTLMNMTETLDSIENSPDDADSSYCSEFGSSDIEVFNYMYTL